MLCLRTFLVILFVLGIFFFFNTERPLHPKEKVLEQALQWCTMADPSSAYLLVKKVPRREVIDIFTGDFPIIYLWTYL